MENNVKDIYLEEDLTYIANSDLPFEELYGKTVLVTGATGLVGSQTVMALLKMNELKQADIEVLAFVRDTKKADKVYGECKTNKLIYVVGDVNTPITADTVALSDGRSLDDVSISYIVHAASPTASKYFVSCPVETIMTAMNGTKNCLELAKNKEAEGVVYLSSMEAFGITDPQLADVKEADLGYIDIHNPRSSYSEGKRICECICASYASEYGVPVRIARLSQTFGAGISYAENRVFAQFAKSAIEKKDIVLHTAGKSVGNYCYTRDSVMGILLLLLRGNSGEAYTVANPKSNITIGNMAKMVAEKIAGNEIQVIFDIPESAMTYGYAPDVNMRLNSDKLQALGWKPVIGLEESYRRMIGSMLATKEETAD
jgi:nucleoside-diphosphate-sugar epimerase